MSKTFSLGEALDQVEIDETLAQYVDDPDKLRAWILSVARALRQNVRDTAGLGEAAAVAEADYKRHHAAVYLSTFEEPAEGEPPIRWTEGRRKAYADSEAAELHEAWLILLNSFRTGRDAKSALESVLSSLQTIHNSAVSLAADRT